MSIISNNILVPDHIALEDVPLYFPQYTRYEDYLADVCWQHHLRVKNLDEDLANSSLPPEYLKMLACSSVDEELLTFGVVSKDDKVQCREIATFIERYEWLGKLPNRPTHRFTARTVLGDVLCGVIVMAVPNTFSHLLGPESRHMEKLVSRGASISWAPKNTASWLLMKSIRWMALHTPFHLFTAYSDPEAKELGTIYQASNWIYLGQSSGTTAQYYDPERPTLGWFSGRAFRHKSKVNQRAKRLGIELDKTWWKTKYTLDWDKVPLNIVCALKQAEAEHKARCQERLTPAKHKYVYILGQNAPATKILRERFAQLNPRLVGLAYPKERGK